LIWILQLLAVYEDIFSINKFAKDDHTVSPLGVTIKIVADSDNVNKYMELTTIQLIAFISSMVAGIVMLSIRMLEPYFRFSVKRSIYSLYGIVITEMQLEM
jgi:hypothetical protein